MNHPLLLVALFSVGTALAVQAQDTVAVTLATGTHAQAWKTDTGWLEGQLARVFPEGGGECVGFFSEELGGFVAFGVLDSLRIQVPMPDSAQPSGRSDHRWFWQELAPHVLWQRQLRQFPTCSQLL